MKYAVFITGSAGSGKSTTARLLSDHYQILRRRTYLFNLDPACEYLPYQPEMDIRELITTQEVQEYMRLGPNGALIYAFEYFFANEREYLQQNMDFEDDFLIFDCPGQIELYVEGTELQKFSSQLQRKGYECLCLYLIDSSKLTEIHSLLTSVLVSACVRLNLRMPFLLIATKTDLVPPHEIEAVLNQQIKHKFYQEVHELIDESAMAEFTYLRRDDEDLIGELQQNIDQIFNYGE